MKTITLDKAIENRFDHKKLDDINEQAEILGKYYLDLQETISKTIKEYAADHDMGFVELQSALETSKSQTARMLASGSNFTLDTIIKVARLTGKRPKLIFE